MLVAAALLTIGAWLSFMLKAPALHWTERPLPFDEIRDAAWTIGPLTDSMLLLLLLLVAYLALAWVEQTGESDLPAWIVVPTAVISGILAALTYALFAEDVNFVLANAWSYLVAGVNPYVVPPDAVPGHPFGIYTGWTDFRYLYGPFWLAVGVGLLKLVGPNVLQYVLATKLLQLGVLWLLGAAAWKLARLRGSKKPLGAAALVLWNPLLLVDGVMTPHVDLPMAAALVAALLAWTMRREATAVVLFGLSVALKLFTVLLLPAAPLALIAAGAFARPGRRNLVLVTAATCLVGVLLWPGVWQPFLQYGLQQELKETSHAALIPNLLDVLQTVGLLPDSSALNVEVAAESLRWVVFTPFWIGTTWLCVSLAVHRQREVPHPLCESFAILLLGFHLLFTLVVLPWHFITVLALCLVAASPAGRRAALLITASALLFYVNDRWIWDYPWSDLSWIAWILGLSLQGGPLVALGLLLRETWPRSGLTAALGSVLSEPRVLLQRLGRVTTRAEQRASASAGFADPG